MNCCNDYGKCDQGHDCPARATKDPRNEHSANLALQANAKRKVPEPLDSPETDFTKASAWILAVVIVCCVSAAKVLFF